MLTANIVVSFSAESADEISAIVGAWTIPIGASVTVTSVETLAHGQVDTQGNLVSHEDVTASG